MPVMGIDGVDVGLGGEFVIGQHRHQSSRPDIRRDQVGAIVSGSLRRDPLALSPAGSQSAPAFQGVSAPVAENSKTEPDRRLAA